MSAWIKSIIVGVIVEIAQKLWAWFMSYVQKLKRSKEQEKAADNFDKKEELDEKLDANRDAVNSGR